MTELSGDDAGSSPRPDDIAVEGAQAHPIDAAFADAARSRWQHLAGVGGDFGRLEEIAAWLSAVQGRCPPRQITHPVAIVVGGDHGIARTSRTSRTDPARTASAMRSICDGVAAISAIARVVDVTVHPIDAGIDAEPDYLDDRDPRVARSRIRRSTGSIDAEDAMTRAEAIAAIDLGRRVVDEQIDSGADLFVLGHLGVGATTPASSLIASLTSTDPASVCGRGSGIDDDAWMRKVAAVRDAVHRARDAKGDMVELLARIGGPDIAVLTGALEQSAIRRTPVILDGVVVASAALIAHRRDFRSRQWWLAGHLSSEPAHAFALDRLDLTPVLDLAVTHEEGVAGMLTVPIVRSAVAILGEVPTDESHPHGGVESAAT